MKPKTIPTFNCKSEIIFKDMVSFEKNKVMLKDYAPREFAIYFSKIEGSQGRVVYEMSHPVCECGNKYHKHGVVKWRMDKEYNIYKQRYKCPKYNKTKVTPVVNLIDKGCCYTKDVKNTVVNHLRKRTYIVW